MGSGSAVDWLSFTVHEAVIDSPLRWAQLLSSILGVSDLEVGAQERGVVGFTHSAPLVVLRSGAPVNVGKIGWGGASQRGRIYASLGSAICSRVEDWAPCVSQLSQLGARVTRVDLAYDDPVGTRSIEDAVEMYESGLFKSGGRNPICSLYGDWKQVSGHGRTFYVGRRGNGKLLRVYEKGKQLGDRSSPWVRWEVELHNRNRLIPFDVLTNPDHYLAGCFPALSFVSDVKKRICTNRKAVETTLQSRIHHAQISQGQLVNAMLMLGYSDREIVVQLTRPGIPKRLKLPLAGVASDAKLYEAGDGEP